MQLRDNFQAIGRLELKIRYDQVRRFSPHCREGLFQCSHRTHAVTMNREHIRHDGADRLFIVNMQDIFTHGSKGSAGSARG